MMPMPPNIRKLCHYRMSTKCPKCGRQVFATAWRPEPGTDPNIREFRCQCYHTFRKYCPGAAQKDARPGAASTMLIKGR